MIEITILNKFHFIDSEIILLDTNVAIIQETNKQLEEKLRSKLFNINVNMMIETRNERTAIYSALVTID